MRYLEAKRLAQRGEHKMQPGIRQDQHEDSAREIKKNMQVVIADDALEMATDADIDLDLIKGTGKEGMIVLKDVKKIIKARSEKQD